MNLTTDTRSTSYGFDDVGLTVSNHPEGEVHASSALQPWGKRLG